MDLLFGHTDAIILTLLLRGNSYGYDIHKQTRNKREGLYEWYGFGGISGLFLPAMAFRVWYFGPIYIGAIGKGSRHRVQFGARGMQVMFKKGGALGLDK